MIREMEEIEQVKERGGHDGWGLDLCSRKASEGEQPFDRTRRSEG